MGGINFTIQSALSGLRAAQAGIDVVSRNVANANDPNYTKKIQVQNSLVNGFNPAQPQLTNGQGVQLPPVSRAIDLYLQLQARTAGSQQQTYSSIDTYLQRLQQVFGAPGGSSSLGAQMTALHNAFQTLASSPDQQPNQVAVLTAAQSLVNTFNNTTTTIQTLRTQIDQEITNTVQVINTDLTNIYNLNTQVAIAQNTNQSSADLQDERDKYVNDLSQYIGVSTFLRSDGRMAVLTEANSAGGGSRFLIDQTARQASFTALSTITAADAYVGPPAPGAGFNATLNGVTIPVSTAAGSVNVDIKSELLTGKLAGLFQLRDTILPQAQAQIDELAGRMADDFQNLGAAPVQNLRLFINGPTAAGTAFVYNATNVVGFAGKIALNNTAALNDVVGNPWRLRDGTTVGAQSTFTADPTTLNGVLNLFETNQAFTAGTGLPTSATFEGFANGFTGFQANQISVNQGKLADKKALSDALTQRLHNQSGVNVDDELARMIQLQNSYSASARVITTATQMFSTLLQIGS
ncbi:MAG: flagellar hook-associated protein FlgK [Proteobacteria bacterium]|nr:flagellar hook-associated protein FlgK [Pseudomonadota bacterium]